MPYTPPSQQSPVASRSDTPLPGRHLSHSKNSSLVNAGIPSTPRPGLPRSTSSATYLHKQRRSPSAKSIGFATGDTSRDTSPSDVDSPVTKDEGNFAANGSLHQPPPPINKLYIPTGAIVSPPDSAQNSSDDEKSTKRGRVRELENLAELQAAIRIIEQHRESSPNRISEEARKATAALGLVIPASKPTTVESAISPLTKEARKIAHSRSNTDSAAMVEITRLSLDSPNRISSDSDLDEDEVRPKKPLMVRKKSGELVRPALRPPSARRRPSSMPGTPTYSKAVHFDSHLEHVRHFLQVDRPLAVSAGSSPVDAYDGELEFPFGNNLGTPPFEWELRLPNFPRATAERLSMPVRVEKVFLSSDNKYLVGTVAVTNLAFHKLVVARFTFDYWKTTSEVVAEYNNDVRRTQANDGQDRFNFSIVLEDQANLENKTMFFCVRYSVNGQEFWDSNNNTNYQVDFTKKAKPQNGKQGMPGNAARPLSSLPHSRRAPPTSSSRPRTAPNSFDDFADGFESRWDFGSFPQPAAKILGETPLRFKSPKAAANLVPDAPNRRSNTPSQAFSNRYDFGASLSAAIQAASNAMGERSGLQDSPSSPTPTAPKSTGNTQKSSIAFQAQKNSFNEAKSFADPTSVSKSSSGSGKSKPAALTSEKPSLQSQSYHELLDKYCFVRSESCRENEES